MAWDITNPSDTDAVRSGAGVIRQLKTDLQVAFNAVEFAFPGSDTPNPKLIYTPKYGLTGARPASPTTGQLYINTTFNVIERYNGASWDPVATLIPTGTVMIFYQAAAPTGWTQVTTSNDAALRVVSGAGGGTGGTDSIAAPPTHSHSNPDVVDFATSGGPTNTYHNPTSNAVVAFSPKYVDVIVCSKN